MFYYMADLLRGIRFGLQIVFNVCTLHNLIIINMQSDLKTLNLYNACQIYSVECVSTIKHILSGINYTICGAVCSQFTDFPFDDGDNIYVYIYIYIDLTSSSIRKYGLVSTV